MKTSFALLTLAALVLVTAPLHSDQADPPKSPPADVGPGRIAWFDITTTKLPQSKEFYAKLFDWTFTPLRGTTGVGVGRALKENL